MFIDTLVEMAACEILFNLLADKDGLYGRMNTYIFSLIIHLTMTEVHSKRRLSLLIFIVRIYAQGE